MYDPIGYMNWRWYASLQLLEKGFSVRLVCEDRTQVDDDDNVVDDEEWYDVQMVLVYLLA